MNDKKNRDCNFTQIEIELLYENIIKFTHIIENKKTDNTTSSAKKRAWDKMADEFRMNGHNRSGSQLEAKWKGLKAVLINIII